MSEEIITVASAATGMIRDSADRLDTYVDELRSALEQVEAEKIAIGDELVAARECVDDLVAERDRLREALGEIGGGLRARAAYESDGDHLTGKTLVRWLRSLADRAALSEKEASRGE